MDSVDLSTAGSTGGNRRRVNTKNRDWHKRLHLRKTAIQPPTMQSEDKRGPKKIAEEREQSTVWPSLKKPPQEAQHSQRRTNDNGNTLRFTCSQCRDNLEYVPKDLVRHFEENHRGSPPVFPCHMCTFSTHEFSYFQVHLLSHEDTFSSCSICNDNVQRTWSEFSAHLTVSHCQNGKYSCQMCPKFSTGDTGVFLEHMYAHNLGLEGAGDDLSLHTKDKHKFGPKPTTQTLRCQHCGYEASHKLLITKHIKAVHLCQNGNQRKKRKEVHSLAMKPNDPIPKVKPRLTRSAVREMCWLTQDCLSLPGREFLDKYCHLSDPQTTLEETQQFLMKSVAGETGDQKWTKALKTVLSNVPQEMSLHPKSENGIVSNSADLTVLTVKNKITVAQNGGTYTKKLKMMTPPDKETTPAESGLDDPCCVANQNGHQSNLNGPTSCLQNENHNLKTAQELEEQGQKHEELMHEDGINITSELKLTSESKEQASVQKVVPKYKRRRRSRRQKRKARSKKMNEKSAGLSLKIVLKKNPVKEKQWVSQRSLSPSGGGVRDDCCRLPSPHIAMENTAQLLQNALLTEACHNKWTKASKSDLQDPSGSTSNQQSTSGEEQTPSCAAKAMGSKDVDRNTPVMPDGLLSTHREMQDGVKKSLESLVTEVDTSGRTGQSNLRAAAMTEVEVRPENVPLQTSDSGMDCHMSGDGMSSAADGLTPHCRGATTSSPGSQAVITPQDKVHSEDLSLALSSEQSVEVIRDSVVLADSLPDLLSNTTLPPVKAIQQEPSPASRSQRQPVPKNLERTLKLVAINPSQLVKRPAGDQPVVVLNHPDADIPEVARIMEVVNRYRGEVQKVVLSRRTVNALSAMNGEVPKTNDPTDAQPDSPWLGSSSVQERFVLKLKLRRISRKKYEVVGAASPSGDAAATTKFRCWFCGRVFTSQETWMVHRQRHLMEWRRPNCENS